jgi:nucleoside-diphosphate-sugar epimerase
MINASLESKTLGKTYILAENKVYSSEDIFDIISKVLGKWTITIPLPTSLLYVLALFFEGYAKIFNSNPVLTRNELMSYQKYRFWRFRSTLAKKDFGFQIRFPLPEGIKITADWYKKNNLI